MYAKKSLGQNFLTSHGVAHSIIEAADIKEGDTVLEIGPGEGFLTSHLLETPAKKVIALEKDHRLIPLLSEKYEKEIPEGKLELLERDVLEFDPDEIRTKGYKVVANIPYYITGQIIRMFLTSDSNPESMVLLVQKEVADRIVARDGKESILSLSVKAYGAPKIIRRVSRALFRPSPNVDSSVLLIHGISKEYFKSNNISEDLFFRVVKEAFGQKRKRLGSTVLKNKEDLTDWKEKRPEDLSLKDWSELLKVIS